ncbi:unnamed protein product [Brassica oleracea]
MTTHVVDTYAVHSFKSEAVLKNEVKKRNFFITFPFAYFKSESLCILHNEVYEEEREHISPQIHRSVLNLLQKKYKPRAKWGISRGSVSIDLQCQSNPCPGLCKLKRTKLMSRLLKHEARSLLRHIVKDVPNSVLKHITVQKNEDKPKTILEKKVKQHQTHKQVSEENSTEDEKKKTETADPAHKESPPAAQTTGDVKVDENESVSKPVDMVENGC